MTHYYCYCASQIGVLTQALRSLEWAFIKTSLRRYEPLPKGQNVPVERRLSIPNILLDALDLVCNHRGIGWLWSSRLSPRRAENPCPIIPGVLARLLIKLVPFDTAHYLMQYTYPSLKHPACDTLFDPSLTLIRRCAKAAFWAPAAPSSYIRPLTYCTTLRRS